MGTEKVSTVLFLVVAICVISMGGILLIFYLADGSRETAYTQPAQSTAYVQMQNNLAQQQMYIQEMKQAQQAAADKQAADKVLQLQRQVNALEDDNMLIQQRYSSLEYDMNSHHYYRHGHYYDNYNNDNYNDGNYDESGNSNEADLMVYVQDNHGNDLEDARVEIQDGSNDVEYTDGNGKAAFNNINNDCYDIRVSKSGYHDSTDHTCVDSGQNRGITVELQED